MAELENLEIVISVIDRFESELNSLLDKLAQVKVATEAVDDIDIDVDVHGNRQLDALLARLAMVQGGTVGAGGGGGGMDLGGGGGGGDGDLPTNLRRAAAAADEAAEGLLAGDIAMSDLHNAIARLVPLILTVIGAVPALIGGFYALAAAAAAAAAALVGLTGFAALGLAMQLGGGDASKGFKQIFERIKEDFFEAFTPLARRLAPVFENALDGLERLFQRIANQGDALAAFTDDAKALGGFILDTFPTFLRDVGMFADAMSNTFALLASFGKKVDVFAAMAHFLAQVIPPLADFVTLLASFLPVLLRISIGFLRATNGILLLINGLAQLINLLGITEETFGLVVGATLAALSVFLLLNSAMVANIIPTLINVGQAAVSAATSMFGLAEAEMVAALGSATLAKALFAVAGALALTGIGALLVLFGGIASHALSASNGIDQATRSLKEFQRQSRRMSGRNPYAQPEVQRGEVSGQSRFAGSNIAVTIEGNAKAEDVRNQTQNALYRMERPRRSI